ncbi:hypothetical protein RhiirB3_447683 [Rhizophagus irregularis]|nr:hypothetical protein RhiirB3_447683 [Rhizophagus irregularis]
MFIWKAGLSNFWDLDISRWFRPHFRFRRRQLGYETRLYKISVWVLDLVSVSVPLSGSKLKLDDLTSISMSLILGSGIEFEKQLFGSLKHADYGRSSLFEHDIYSASSKLL